MARFARGKFALGISDRSGKQYKLNEMRKEWNGLVVGPDEYDPKHPQLDPPPVTVDAQALRRPRPDQAETLVIGVGGPRYGQQFYYPIVANGQIGQVTVTIT